MISIILIIILICYVFQMLLLRLGLGRSERSPEVSNYHPTVSIIVAARNEEKYIGRCLSSLIELEYPTEKLEIIIVNDNSMDKTSEIVQSYLNQHPSLKYISATPGSGNLLGKANAISQGISISSGEIVMFTDADCEVRSSWVRESVKYFDEKTGIVGSFTLLEAHHLFEKVQALDWMFLLGLASSTSGWNLPLTAIGNNLAVRRCAYDATGGYAKIPFSVTEDYSLIQMILKKSQYQIRFPLDPQTLITSKACQNWKQLYRQKQRWGVGGLDMIFRGMLIMAIGWLTKCAFLFSVFYSPISITIMIFSCMCIVEIVFLWKPLKRFSILYLLKYFLIFEVYFTLYVILIPFIAFFSRKVVWKERAL